MIKNIYKTSRWLKVRAAVLRRDRFECQQCKRFGRSVLATTVHHLKPYQEEPALAYASTNLISLCPRCHGEAHVLNQEKLSAAGRELMTRVYRRLETAETQLK